MATSQAQAGPNPPVAENPKDEVLVTPQASLADIHREAAGQGHTEERIEYRDENGKLLDEAEVKELEGKVSFSTRYETRTRLIDPDGNEIYEGVVDEESWAGTIADGENPETPGAPEGMASSVPASNNAAADVAKEAKVDQPISKQDAEPESLVGKASGKDEL